MNMKTRVLETPAQKVKINEFTDKILEIGNNQELSYFSNYVWDYCAALEERRRREGSKKGKVTWFIRRILDIGNEKEISHFFSYLRNFTGALEDRKRREDADRQLDDMEKRLSRIEKIVAQYLTPEPKAKERHLRIITKAQEASNDR